MIPAKFLFIFAIYPACFVGLFFGGPFTLRDEDALGYLDKHLGFGLWFMCCLVADVAEGDEVTGFLVAEVLIGFMVDFESKLSPAFNTPVAVTLKGCEPL